MDVKCYWCKQEIESLDHLFLQCPAAKALWLALDLAGIIQNTPLNSVSCLMECIKKL